MICSSRRTRWYRRRFHYQGPGSSNPHTFLSVIFVCWSCSPVFRQTPVSNAQSIRHFWDCLLHLLKKSWPSPSRWRHITLRELRNLALLVNGLPLWKAMYQWIKSQIDVGQSISQLTASPGCYHTSFFMCPFCNSLLFFQALSTLWQMFLLISLGEIFIQFLITDVPVRLREDGIWCELQQQFADCAADSYCSHQKPLAPQEREQLLSMGSKLGTPQASQASSSVWTSSAALAAKRAKHIMGYIKPSIT